MAKSKAGKGEKQCQPGPFAFVFNLMWSGTGFPSGSEGEESACKAGDLGWIPSRSPGGGNVCPLQSSFLEDCGQEGPLREWEVEFGNLIRNLTELREGHFSLKEEDSMWCAGRTARGYCSGSAAAVGDEAAVPAVGNEGARGLQFPQARQAWWGLREVSSRGVRRAVLNPEITDLLRLENGLEESKGSHRA